MLKPENTHPGDNADVLRDNDLLETTESGLAPGITDSASTAADAGLVDESADFDSALDSDFDEAEPAREITMTDAMANVHSELHMPELSDMNAPGELDIEELDDDTVEEALPPDARLDPLEP